MEIWKVKATLVRVQRLKRRAGEKAYIFFRQYKDNHEWNAGRNIYMKVVSGDILDRKKTMDKKKHLFPIFWKVRHRGSCCDVCQIVFCLCSPLGVL